MSLTPDKEMQKKEKECPNCKSLNDPSIVICSYCSINFIEYENSQPLDLNGLSNLRKRKRE